MQPLIPHFIQQKYLVGETSGVLSGYTVFVDMSGFTRLTSVLMEQGKEGAERLSVILNDVFGPMVSCVYDRGGRIPYFAGDAFTAIFEGKKSENHALEIMEISQHLLQLLQDTQSKIPEFKIGVKIGLGYGDIDWGIVGGEQKAFYFNGSGIDACIESQKLAEDGEIIFGKQIFDIVGKTQGWELYKKPDFYRVTKKIKLKNRQFAPSNPEEVIEEVAKKFLPESVMKFNQQGEFRTVISVFISFEGVTTHDELDEFTKIVLGNITKFSGYFKEVDYGDKGGILLGFFGAPVSYENNVERALEFLLTTQEELVEFQEKTDLKYRVGVTSGMAYAGIVGGPERCQYAAVGTNVNLAARLMIYADWGDIMVDSVVQKDRNFVFKYRGEVNYKGFSTPIATYKFEGRNVEQEQEYHGKMVGREEELTQLLDIAKKALTEDVQVTYVFGEAGIGKSRLTYELKQKLRKTLDFNWFNCRSDQILQKPFNPFLFFLKKHFDQSSDYKPAENRANFERRFSWLVNDCQAIEHDRVEGILRELIRTKPVLAAILGIKYEKSLWDELDAKGRYQNTISALTALFLAESLVKPLVLELEDGHWFDDNSKAFLQDFLVQIRELPIYILVTSRYNDEGQKPFLFPIELLETQNVSLSEFDLNTLKTKGMKSFAEYRLGGKIHDDLKDLLKRTTNGNPFYLEQMLEYFIESNLLIQEDNIWTIKDKNVRISNSINAILTARIDRLSNLVKETVKTAAVIGREFEVPILKEVMRLQEDTFGKEIAYELLTEQIKSAEKGQIWQAMNELRYIFRHSLLREAVYEMQLGARVRELHHFIALAIEKIYVGNLESKYVDLAFHYEQAENENKTLEYLEKAADLTRDLYQNQQAIRYYDKLIDLQEKKKSKHKVIKTMLKKGSVLQLIGRWNEAEKTFDDALTRARSTDDLMLIGRANNTLGQLLLLRGNYEDANMYLEAAAAFFEAIQDQKGIAKVYGDLGNLYFRQGNYEDAKSHFIRSIQMSELYDHSTSNAQIVANLGLTYMNLGDFQQGIKWQQSQLEICKDVHDRQGMATLNVNMGIVHFESGDFDRALDCFEKGLKLSEELGNKLLVAIAVGSLGRVYERQGNYEKAMELFEDDLRITEELGDKQGISIALGLIGELKGVLGEFEEARRFMDKNLAISEELGYQKGIAKAVNMLGDLYYAQRDYEKAIRYYDKAIKITKEIGQLSVLTGSLVEKGMSLVYLDRVAEANKMLKESAKIAKKLGNFDLIFETEILKARLQAKAGKLEAAESTLRTLLLEKLDKDQEANVHYALFILLKSEKSRQKATAIYQDLYEGTPKYVIKKRLEDLEE